MKAYTLLRLAAVNALLALALMMWSFFDRRPIVLVAAMTLGQALGTLSLGLYLAVVALDLRRKGVLRYEGHKRRSADAQKP